MEARIVLTTAAPERASALAQELVEGKLSACVNILPAIQSIYFWDGKVRDDTEVLLIIKTEQQKIAALQTYIEKHHGYEVPEFVVLTPETISPRYLDWLLQSVRR